MRIRLLVGLAVLAVVVPLFGQQPAPQPQPGQSQPPPAQQPAPAPQPQAQGEQPQPAQPLQVQPTNRGRGFGPLVKQLADRLELTPEQKVQYDKIAAKYQTQAEQQRNESDELRQLAEQYRQARQSGDQAKADQLREQIRTARSGQTQVFHDFTTEVEPILTPQQVEKLHEFRDRFAGGPRGRPGNEVQILLRAVRQLDLRDDQRDRVRQIARDAQTEQRDSTDPQATADLAKRLKSQIVALLDANQAAEFERLIAQAAEHGRNRNPDTRPAGHGGGALQRHHNRQGNAGE